MDMKQRSAAGLPSAGDLRMVNDGGQPRTVDPNGRVMRLRAEEGTPVHAVRAAGVLTGTTIAAADTVTIAGVVFTFVAALSAPVVPNEVLVGISDSASLDNLIAAINGAAGAGTTYSTGTVRPSGVSAGAGAGDTMDLSATVAGVSGNTILTASSLTAGGWSAPSLFGGVDATEASRGDMMQDSVKLYVAIADVLKSSMTGWTEVGITGLGGAS